MEEKRSIYRSPSSIPSVILSEVEGSEPALSILEGRSDSPSHLSRHPERKLRESKDLREAISFLSFSVMPSASTLTYLARYFT
jgi:hypothetical protein